MACFGIPHRILYISVGLMKFAILKYKFYVQVIESKDKAGANGNLSESEYSFKHVQIHDELNPNF